MNSVANAESLPKFSRESMTMLADGIDEVTQRADREKAPGTKRAGGGPSL